MKNALLRGWIAATLVALAICPRPASAERDTFWLGSGRSGSLTVSEVGKVINQYVQVTGPLGPGATTIPVTSASGFAKDDLVLVFQSTGIVPVPVTGSPSSFDLLNDPVGSWELARLASASGTTLSLTAPLSSTYAAQVTQVIRVPEYTSLTIASGFSIKAAPWDGKVGGVIAFLVQETLTNNGTIDAIAAGFRGGAFVKDSGTNTGCSGLDEAAPKGGQKGEGIANTRYGSGTTGLGFVANAGGGGVCFKSGGGGGSNAGQGGKGGRSHNLSDGARDVGGQAGVRMSYSAFDHFLFGGGGGSGHGADGNGGAGGTGGGVVFIRANALAGTGSILADGSKGGASTTDGAGGGGAGGTLYLRFAGTASCNIARAGGARGGNTNAGSGTYVGPGGGGGGGSVLLQSAGGSCTTDIIGESPGVKQDSLGGYGSGYGATAAGPGTRFTRTYGLFSPGVPVVTQPASDSFISSATAFARGTATPNTQVVLYIDGEEAEWATADASGNYLISTSRTLSEGTHQIQVAGRFENIWSAKSPLITYTVDVTRPETSIVSKPPNPSNERNPTFSFDTNEAGASFQCRLEGSSSFTDCSNPYTLSSLADGAYTLYVQARDRAGNTDVSPASYSWSVDTVAPAVPEVTQVGGQAATSTVYTSNSRPVINGNAEAGSSVQVTINLPSGVLTLTTTAASSTNWSVQPGAALAEGVYSLSVRSVDSAGNVSGTTAAVGFVVDTTAPPAPLVTQVGGKVAVTGMTVSASRPVIQGTAEANSQVSVSIDGTGRSTTADASGTWSLTPDFDLGDISHTLSVRAQDRAGNIGASSSFTFKVDTTPPDTTMTSAPSGVVTSSNATLTFTSSEASATFECSLDGAAFASCSSPLNLNGLVDGSHSFQVRAVDSAGNVDASPASASWISDTGAPSVSIVSGPAGVTHTTSATFTFSSNELGATYECSVDGAAFAACSSTVTFTGFTDGPHALQVRAKDPVGNLSETATRTWTVDTMAPDTSITQKPEAQTQETSATFAFQSETGATFECSLDTVAFTACSSPVTYSDLASGNHTFSVRAKDAVGNVDATPASHSWAISRPTNPGGGEEEPSGGCGGCAASGFDPAMSMMALAGLAAFVSRRRRP